MVLNLKLGDRVIGEIKKIVEITHPIVNPLPIHKDRELNLSKIDGNGGRSENLARKEGVKKQCGGGGDCLEMKCCQIILRFFWRFLMTQDRKKILMCLSFLC